MVSPALPLPKQQSWFATACRLLPAGYHSLHWAYWFGQVDSRPLSLFRLCFGALLLKNALYALPLARLFYSDEGIVPRAQFWDDPAQVGLGRFSVLNYVATPWLAMLCFGLWAAISLALLLGYRTRTMAVLIYLCKLSLLNRNPFPLSGADHVMTALSFWMIFLPLNHHYAVDGWLARRRQRVAGGQTAPLPTTTYAFPVRVIQLQVALIYLFTTFMKWQGLIWRSGDALYYTFQQNGYLLPTGIWVGAHSPLWLLRGLAWSTLLIEAGFTLLVFLPVRQPWAKACGLLLTASVHLGIALTMAIPDFSLVMWISYLLFFEPVWVIWLERQVRRVLRLPPLLATPAFTPATQPAPPLLEPGARIRSLAGRGLLTAGLTLVLMATIWGGLEEGGGLRTRLAPPLPPFLKAIDHQLQLASAWPMFVYPIIPRTGWLQVDGQWADGATGILYSSADPATGQMYHLWGPSARLRLLEQHLLGALPSPILRAWGQYYCRLYNADSPQPPAHRLATLEIHLHYRWSHRPGAPAKPYDDDLLWRQQCLGR